MREKFYLLPFRKILKVTPLLGHKLWGYDRHALIRNEPKVGNLFEVTPDTQRYRMSDRQSLIIHIYVTLRITISRIPAVRFQPISNENLSRHPSHIFASVSHYPCNYNIFFLVSVRIAFHLCMEAGHVITLHIHNIHTSVRFLFVFIETFQATRKSS